MQKGTGKFSRPIVTIAILGIILGVAVMILSASIVRGFRTEIRDKVVGFNAHLQVTDLKSGAGTEDKRVYINEPFAAELAAIDGVNRVRPFIVRPTILESPEGIEGVLAKGLAPADIDDFLSERLTAGRMPDLSQDSPAQEVLLSASLAKSLDVSIDEKISLYFITEGTDFSTRRLKISGIYQTDLEEFDRQYVFLDRRHLQRLSGWGLEVQARVSEECTDQGQEIEALGFGGLGRQYFRWSNGEVGPGPYRYCSADGQPLEIELLDDQETLADTATIYFKPSLTQCACPYVVDSVQTSGGSGKYYVGGFEIFLDNFDDLEPTRKEVRALTGPFFYTSDIVLRTPEIFSWLEILDVNIYIIITLMIGVAIFNMSSALLILIIERSNMIGILKAMGAHNWSVRKIFIRHAGKLILKGLFWGNVIGLGIAMFQKYFQPITLSAETYYLKYVPILISPWDLLFIDLGTLIICMLAMLIPSYFITKITPVKAIRFD